jgi:hypothetical protein
MVANSLYWTTVDLDAMPDHGGWLRHEVIEGELFVTQAPHIRHQGAAGQIQVQSRKLVGWVARSTSGSGAFACASGRLTPRAIASLSGDNPTNIPTP